MTKEHTDGWWCDGQCSNAATQDMIHRSVRMVSSTVASTLWRGGIVMRVAVSDESMAPVGISNGVGIRKEMHREVKSLRNEGQFPCVSNDKLG